jgi:hypothetical protein
MKSTDFVVARNDLQHCKFIEDTLNGRVPPDQGHILSLVQ